jgi:hypothetical protein
LLEQTGFELTVLFAVFWKKSIAGNILEMLVRIHIARAEEIRTNGALLSFSPAST